MFPFLVGLDLSRVLFISGPRFGARRVGRTVLCRPSGDFREVCGFSLCQAGAMITSGSASSHRAAPPPPRVLLVPDCPIASQRYEALSDADGRENAAAVTEIDDFLKRSQDVVGSGTNDGDAAEPVTGSSVDVTNGASRSEGPSRRRDGEGPKRPDRWVGAPRWSRNRET